MWLKAIRLHDPVTPDIVYTGLCTFPWDTAGMKRCRRSLTALNHTNIYLGRENFCVETHTHTYIYVLWALRYMYFCRLLSCQMNKFYFCYFIKSLLLKTSKHYNVNRTRGMITINLNINCIFLLTSFLRLERINTTRCNSGLRRWIRSNIISHPILWS